MAQEIVAAPVSDGSRVILFAANMANCPEDITLFRYDDRGCPIGIVTIQGFLEVIEAANQAAGTMGCFDVGDVLVHVADERLRATFDGQLFK